MHVPLPLMDYSPAMTGTAIVTGASRAAGELRSRRIRLSRGIMLECAGRLGMSLDVMRRFWQHANPQFMDMFLADLRKAGLPAWMWWRRCDPETGL